MPSVCFYFQVHQPYRLRRYTYFDIGASHEYFDEGLNRSIMRRVAERCYLPANERIARCIERYNGDFKVAFSISGTALEQMRDYAPEVLASFKELAATGCVEFLGETYYHSLASLYDEQEFREQVMKHAAAIQREFGRRPKVFRNTELIYNDAIGAFITQLGFTATLVEGVEDILGWRSPNFVYRIPDGNLKLLPKNFKLSDDIAFRFSQCSEESSATLTPALFAQRLHALDGNAEVVGLFLDYETFGEHHKREDGILELLSDLPERILSNSEWNFVTPSEVVKYLNPISELSFPRTTSWADTQRDVSAWCGNSMQQAALVAAYDLRGAVYGREAHDGGFELLRETWRRLQSSDHFYYMSTKGGADGSVHSYFSPFESPYDAFIAYMNVLKDIAGRTRFEGATDRASCNQ